MEQRENGNCSHIVGQSKLTRNTVKSSTREAIREQQQLGKQWLTNKGQTRKADWIQEEDPDKVSEPMEPGERNHFLEILSPYADQL